MTLGSNVIGRTLAALALAGALACQPALADIYTWVDASGRVNVSNLPPPEGARVTSVSREDPSAAAFAKAAREAAHRDDVAMLNERLNTLESQLDATRSAPPPIPYAPPAPPPPAYPPVIAQTIVVPAPQTYADCGDPWSCGGAGYPAFYPGLYPGFFPGFYPSVIVVRDRGSHRFDPTRPAHRMPVPGRGSTPGGLANALPDPVNLFPRSNLGFADVRMR